MEDVIAAKLGDVGMVGDEVVQEVCELVARAQYHVAALQVLVDDSQVEVVAEGVDVHQVPHLVTLLSEEHGELERTEGGGHGHFQHVAPTEESTQPNPSGKLSHCVFTGCAHT